MPLFQQKCVFDCEKGPLLYSVTVNQHVQLQDPETGAAKWNSATINFMIYCAFSTVIC